MLHGAFFVPLSFDSCLLSFDFLPKISNLICIYQKKTLPLQPKVAKTRRYAKIISRYQKALLSAIRVAEFADRAYFYDNSIDNQNAQLLFRTTEGKLAKQYVSVLPQWTETIFEKVH